MHTGSTPLFPISQIKVKANFKPYKDESKVASEEQTKNGPQTLENSYTRLRQVKEIP